MKTINQVERKWLFRLKRRVLFALAGLLILGILLSSVLLYRALVNDSRHKMREVALTIQSALIGHMLRGDPDIMQRTLEEIGSNGESIVSVMILDRIGRIAYSSDRNEIGRVLEGFSDMGCRGCHTDRDAGVHDRGNIIVKEIDSSIQRNVMEVFNEKECYGCHDSLDRINGKLIIDSSMKSTHSLILTVESFMLGGGLVFLVMLYSVLSRSFDHYIREILRRHSEVSLLYSLVDRLNQSIDIEELKFIIVDIIRDTLGADQVIIIIPKDEYFRAMSWTSATNLITRAKISEEDSTSVVLVDWLEGRLKDDLVSQDDREVYLPINKDGYKLSLITARKIGGKFDLAKLMLVRAISSHFSVAFENARLYSLAITDELTGLYTKRHFVHQIEKDFSEYQKKGEEITLLMMDIDDFKQVNDTYGHIMGDYVLKMFGKCVMESIKQTDTAFRYGGEEFAVLLSATGMNGGKFVAERIRSEVEACLIEKAGVSIRMTVSIGIANCPKNASAVEDLIRTADKALYEAKRSGKNRVVVSSVEPG